MYGFNGHPPLGVNATLTRGSVRRSTQSFCFNEHPPLGVNATLMLAETGIPISMGFQWAPTLGGECYREEGRNSEPPSCCFNGHPPLGVNSTLPFWVVLPSVQHSGFQWAPTLGGECYVRIEGWQVLCHLCQFQWAPTLGGECYTMDDYSVAVWFHLFQWAPTLGGECYKKRRLFSRKITVILCFNGHPPLGVNATV